jgi:Flp pilus assembly protein TadD
MPKKVQQTTNKEHSNGLIVRCRLPIAKTRRTKEYSLPLGHQCDLSKCERDHQAFGPRLAYVLESRANFVDAIPPLEKAVALSRRKDWRCLADLAKVYGKTGRTVDAIQTAREALDLTVKQDNQQVAKTLQDALDHYERDGSGAKSN